MMISWVANYMECHLFWADGSRPAVAEITCPSCISVVCSQEPPGSHPETDDISTLHPSGVCL